MKPIAFLGALALATISSAAKEEVTLFVARDAAPGPSIRLSVMSKNLREVPVAIYRLSVAEYLQYISKDVFPKISGVPVRRLVIDVAQKNPVNKAPQDTYYNRQVNLPVLPSGFYLLSAERSSGGQPKAVTNITNLAVVTKLSESRILTWVTKAKSGEVIPAAEVSVYKNTNRLSSGRTGSDGVSYLPPVLNGCTVLVRYGTELAAVNSRIDSSEGSARVHLQTDRPIYRPGDQVQFKAILRRTKGVGYFPIRNERITAELSDPNNTLVDRTLLTSNGIGTCSGAFSIPREGGSGNYSIHLKGNKLDQYIGFSVASYRKPEFRVAVTPLSVRNFAGDAVKLRVSADYFFGAKLPGANVQYTVRRQSMESFSGERFADPESNLYAEDTYRQNLVVATGNVKTDASGEVVIEFPSTKDAPDSVYSVEAVVTDGTRRQVTQSAWVNVYAASVRVSIRPLVGYVPLGRLFPLEVRLMNLDGAPISGVVKLNLLHYVYNEKQRRNIEEPLESTEVRVPKSGLATIQLPAKAENSIVIRATSVDTSGRDSKASTSIYVASPSEKLDEKSGPEISIRTNNRSYFVGGEVKGFISYNRKRPVLITMEGHDVFRHQVLNGSGNIAWKLTANMAPNVYVNATGWEGSNQVGANQMIPVVDVTRRLQIKVTPSRAEYSPGDQARFRVETRDVKGALVPTEVAVSVVDAAIFAIAGSNTLDPYDAFWGLRSNQVSTAMSSPSEFAGGAYQNVKFSAFIAGAGRSSRTVPVRSRFVDTAYWNPTVITGADGVGELSFEVPGNLTTWRANATAINAATQVGQASASVLASRPVTLRLATPRQMVVGDKINLIATVTNRTSSALPVRLRLGTAADHPEQTLVVPAKGDARATFPISAPSLGNIRLLGELFNSSGLPLDALEVSVPVVPNGVLVRSVMAGRLTGQPIMLEAPSDRIPGRGDVKLRLYAGPQSVIDSLEQSTLNGARYSPVVAAAQLSIAARRKLGWREDNFREPLAMLGRSNSGIGWGWWNQSVVDPVVTARVLYAFIEAANYPEANDIRNIAKQAAAYQYRNTGLWESRAFLVEALVLAKTKEAENWVREVSDHRNELSPTARLAIAEAQTMIGNEDAAVNLVTPLIKVVSRGASETYLPVGEGVGWAGSELEANARLLSLLVKLKLNPTLTHEIAAWLQTKVTGWTTPTDSAAASLALRAYQAAYPGPRQLGEVALTVNGQEVPIKIAPNGDTAEATWPLVDGSTTLNIRTTGNPRYAIETRVTRKVTDSTDGGIRTQFRWEVQNIAGAWEELARPVKPNEPVRCTALIWGDSVTDAVKVTLPIPAGFEYVDEDELGTGTSQVSDGTVTYYSTLANGLPATFRFYLRTETDGEMQVLPATAEVVRRPQRVGNSKPARVQVAGG